MSAPLNWHKWLVLSLLGLALSARTIGCDYSSITEKFGAEAVARCNEKCPFQNRTGNDHFDVSCGSDCSVQQWHGAAVELRMRKGRVRLDAGWTQEGSF
ncbi:hypothetical protein SFRURICE_013658 [Spodoptera frugiperda]|uniref:SFRICE_038677 n=1 Tax=Spodoptera frugiperda TaxID=7108 RepID=A0A2H1WD87_SPOFR|nr:hypothetical protein SFRURICE_013658 [Spodoptera frugiperda]